MSGTAVNCAAQLFGPSSFASSSASPASTSGWDKELDSSISSLPDDREAHSEGFPAASCGDQDVGLGFIHTSVVPSNACQQCRAAFQGKGNEYLGANRMDRCPSCIRVFLACVVEQNGHRIDHYTLKTHASPFPLPKQLQNPSAYQIGVFQPHGSQKTSNPLKPRVQGPKNVSACPLDSAVPGSALDKGPHYKTEPKASPGLDPLDLAGIGDRFADAARQSLKSSAPDVPSSLAATDLEDVPGLGSGNVRSHTTNGLFPSFMDCYADQFDPSSTMYSFGGRHFQQPGGTQGGGSGDGNGGDGSSYSSQASPPQDTSGPRWDCPLRKWNPNANRCTRDGFTNVSKVKEHITRDHNGNDKCPRCWRRHRGLSHGRGCVEHEPSKEYLSLEEIDEIKSPMYRLAHTANDVENWFTLFDLVHRVRRNHVFRPSNPYFDPDLSRSGPLSPAVSNTLSRSPGDMPWGSASTANGGLSPYGHNINYRPSTPVSSASSGEYGGTGASSIGGNAPSNVYTPPTNSTQPSYSWAGSDQASPLAVRGTTMPSLQLPDQDPYVVLGDSYNRLNRVIQGLQLHSDISARNPRALSEMKAICSNLGNALGRPGSDH